MPKSNAYTNLTNSIGQKEVEKKVTPQTKAIPGRAKEMARNNAGGVSFKVDTFTHLDRFLILGTEGGTYYASEKKHTAQAGKGVITAIKADGVRAVERIVEISKAGRAPKNTPALTALALALTEGDIATKEAAVLALQEVARTGTHLFQFAELVNGITKFNGKNTPEQRALRNWYINRSAMSLAKQITKYAQRDGWAHQDLIRLSHPKAPSAEHDALFAYAVGKQKSFGEGNVAEYMAALTELKAAKTAKDAIRLISAHQFSREVVPTELLNDNAVWEALLPHMGTTALVRNLATMTRNGAIQQTGEFTKAVIAKLLDGEAVIKDRFHPISAIIALMTYKSGRGERNTWTPVGRIVDALDELFYLAFGAVTPTGKRIGYFIDVSGSMGWESSQIKGVPNFYARDAAAVLAMVSARVEKDYVVAAFSSGGWNSVNAEGIKTVNISPRQRLDDIVRTINAVPAGGTDCSLPMLWADKNKIDLDGFVVLTDNETYAGRMHPSQAMQQYRGNRGIPAKLVVVGMTATEFTIADPKDAGMMDVVGFDSAAPNLMSGFIRGDF